ncbi:MAG TPA: carboxypeptidase regulatory-like domain-containing protein [Thermoanaerobaculia bacterium]|nr:carboxypeptidase regulatory-like domain-containing protein [Thermoanaerobaculia bacterium]
MSNLKRWAIVLVALSIISAPALLAQSVTTGTLAGSVTTRADNSALPGVTIEAVHQPTGTRYTSVTDSKGHWEIPNARVGGPYRVTATLSGFKTVTAENVSVRLGEVNEVPAMKLDLATVSEAITVTATPDTIINPGHTGATSNVTTQQIQTLPTVNRALQDFARTNPYFDVSPTSSDGTFMTVLGQNFRYNNIQIDGAVNNDLFGLASTGTPGGQTSQQPIPLDALQQMQLVVSPYDVRQSGFTGGGLNVVTRSGTNKFEGDIFGTKRNKSYIGKGPFNTSVATFDQTQWGGRLGGPIIQDKLFFFVSGEENRKTTPLGAAADGSAGTNYNGTGTGATPSAQLVRDYVKNTYGYDPGSLGDISFAQPNNLAFARLDFNLNNSNNITLRHNYVEGTSDVAPSSYSRTTSRFYFPTDIYSIADTTHSTVAQINSVFGPNFYNEGRLNYTTIRDSRSIPVIFPTVEIGGSGQRNGSIQLGTERFSGANYLNQNITELTDDFTWVKGAHTLTFGTHNELYSFKNLFIQDFYGYYYFPTLDAFEANQPTGYSIGFSLTPDPKAPAAFSAGQYSLYANDQWRVNNRFTVTLGLRADKPHYPDTPAFNPAVQTGLGFNTSAVPSTSIIWEPRVGFNWDPLGDGKQQFRGGIGIFEGKAPYVWISDAFGNTGGNGSTVVLTCAPPSCTPPPFNPDPNAQPRNLGNGVPSIALTNPDFQFPRVLRTTLGYDRDLFWGIKGTAEVLWSKTQQDIYYENVNFKQNGTSPLDGRPTYTRVATNLGDSILLMNTSKGNNLAETLQLNKAFRNVTLSGSYSHQNAKTAFDGTSSIAYSNWQFMPNGGNIFDPVLSQSNYQVKNRFNIAATYNFNTGSFSHGLGLYYDAESGEPYSLMMGGDVNKDGTGNDDLLYVPGTGNYILCPSNATTPTATAPCGSGKSPLDAAKFENFLSSVGLNPGKAQILSRNNIFMPWTRRLDFHYELGLPPVYTARVSVTADVLNLLNMFNKNWGVAEFVANNTYTVVTYQGQDAATNKPIYKEAATNRLTPGNQFSTANIPSRWQGRLGLRITF